MMASSCGCFRSFFKCLRCSSQNTNQTNEVNCTPPIVNPTGVSLKLNNDENLHNTSSIQPTTLRSQSGGQCASKHGSIGLSDHNEDDFVSKVKCISGDRKEITEITWKIKKFFELCEMKEFLRHETCIFNAGHSLNVPTVWCFNLQRMRQEGNIGLFLKRLKPFSKGTHDESQEHNSDDVYIGYKCTIFKSNGEAWLAKRTYIPKFETGQRLGFRKLFTLEDLKAALQNKSDSRVLDNDDSLNLQITFTLYLQSENGGLKSELDYITSLAQKDSKIGHDQLLQKDFETLLNTGENSDICLIMEDGTTFLVHKAILIARSPMFAGMFHSKMTESETGIVKIQDISSKTMKSILNYIYCGTVDHLDWCNVGEVASWIYAADKYALKGVWDICDKMLVSGCTPGNALELLAIAQQHSFTLAERSISMFIRMNVKEIFDTTSKIQQTPYHSSLSGHSLSKYLQCY